MIKPVITINVTPNLPWPLEQLRELALNLRWSWDADCIALFRRLDPELWRATDHNPVQLLGMLSQERLDDAATDASFLAHMQRICASRDAEHDSRNTWFLREHGEQPQGTCIAYFSMEFGLAESLRTYSGGLGILSGDHLKSASDLGLPLVGVGLLYQEGYFHQYLNADGWQQESYPINDLSNLPLTLMRDAQDVPLRISVSMPGRELYAVIWRVQVGRVQLFLLDSNIKENHLPEDRDLTDRLYGGDRRTRIRQEILMGIGGIRALDALGLRPTICHMNEGHSAFLALERIRQLQHEKSLSFAQAREITRAGNIFTTHTPVPAGLERFEFDLIDEHFNDYSRELGISREEFLNLGREHAGGHEQFSMPVLALRLSSGTNGVSQLHARVSRSMWHSLFPETPVDEVPIAGVTNGIHVQTWVSDEMAELFDRYLDPAWREEDWRPELWAGVDEMPDEELWRVHERQRRQLIAFTRVRLHQQLLRRGFARSEAAASSNVLNPRALTIGFARRFATYKRATLIFRDVPRLKRMVSDPQRPVQFIFAGKAHPHDGGGKDFIRHIIHMAQDPELRPHIVFLQNYDMQVARQMVQGVDVWLNNPRRPQEASGTSGMKSIYNAGLNCSILDGWWDEGYAPELGWAIGNGEEYAAHDEGHQDYVESQALYNILEKDIVPLYYERDEENLPREWLRQVKTSMRQLAPVFSSHRMLHEYCERFYMPAMQRVQKMHDDGLRQGLAFSAWRSSLEQYWHEIRIESLHFSETLLMVGVPFSVEARVHLGRFSPDDLRVQLYSGSLNTQRQLGASAGETVDMQPVGASEHGIQRFSAQFTYHSGGERGLSARVLPKHELLPDQIHPGLITWAEGAS